MNLKKTIRREFIKHPLWLCFVWQNELLGFAFWSTKKKQKYFYVLVDESITSYLLNYLKQLIKLKTKNLLKCNLMNQNVICLFYLGFNKHKSNCFHILGQNLKIVFVSMWNLFEITMSTAISLSKIEIDIWLVSYVGSQLCNIFGQSIVWKICLTHTLLPIKHLLHHRKCVRRYFIKAYKPTH